MTNCLVFTGLLASLVGSIQLDTKLGVIEGISTSDPVHQFLNIPYAEPPVKELRWRPPKSLVSQPWEGIRDGTKWGNACAQPSMMHFFSNDLGVEFIEDCLYLNVFTPSNLENGKDKLRPVMFWIHGGGLVIGTAASGIYNASKLAASQDIVVVTINYRLGRAAWFVDPELDGSPTGNGAATGFLDMIEALKWVQHNIESFGGDPNQVTIAGESGGGWAVCGLVVSPLARGLFQRSIQMSGSCIKSVGRFGTPNEVMKQIKGFVKLLNVSTVEQVRTMDMQTIVDAGFSDLSSTNLPGIDGYVFPMSPLELFRNGHINGESVMIGTLFRESFTAEPWNVGWVPEDKEDLSKFYGEHFHDSIVQRIGELYPVDNIRGKVWGYPSLFDDNRAAVLVSTQLQTDCMFRCGSILQTELISDNPITKHVPVYFYQYGWMEEPWDRVTHGQDILHLFGHEVPDGHPMKNQFSVYSEDFTKITQDFFGAYIRGEGVVINDVDASVGNGKYIHVVNEVKAVDLSELDAVKERCDVMFELGDDAFRNMAFCSGAMDGQSPDDMIKSTQSAQGVAEGETGQTTQAADSKGQCASDKDSVQFEDVLRHDHKLMTNICMDERFVEVTRLLNDYQRSLCLKL